LYRRKQITLAEFRAGCAFKRANNRSVVERAIAAQTSEDGVAVVVAVVVNGCTLADVARANGAHGTREVHAVGWLLRRSLDVLAKRLGYHRCPS
jgi:hypothetical protein